MFYDGDEFPQWRGDAFVGALSGMAIIRIEIDGDSAVEADRYVMNARIRGLVQGPDDAIWVIVDGGGTGGRGRAGGFGGRGGGAAAPAGPPGGALLKLTAN
jgi:glucose/arabinose dehydrogenase